MADNKNPYSPPKYETQPGTPIRVSGLLRFMKAVGYVAITIGLLVCLNLLGSLWQNPNGVPTGFQWQNLTAIVPIFFACVFIISFFRLFRYMRELERN